jgi:hypothetical protein
MIFHLSNTPSKTAVGNWKQWNWSFGDGILNARACLRLTIRLLRKLGPVLKNDDGASP